MVEENAKRIVADLSPSDLVLDVGGWACPFNRANWVIDAQPYETRGFYATLGMPKSQGGEVEHFRRETWVQRDICDHQPWPFEAKQFDFSICSHTLEDVRDPLFVCAELIRVSKRGYIEVPSRLIESCRGLESKKIAGLSHHRWLIELDGSHLRFTMKYHMIHGDFCLAFPPRFQKRLTAADRVLTFFWEGELKYSETSIHGIDAIYSHLQQYVEQRYTYPAYRHQLLRLRNLSRRLGRGIRRRFLP